MTRRKSAISILVFATVFGFVAIAGAAGPEMFIAPGDTASLVKAVADPAKSGFAVVLAPIQLFVCGEAVPRLTTLGPPLLQMTGGNVVRNLTVRGAHGPAIAPTVVSCGAGLGMTLNAGGSARNDAEIRVESAGNVFEGKDLGVLVQGGRDFLRFVPGVRTGGSGNRVEWMSQRDAIWNNRSRGGIEANGSVSTNPAAMPSNENRVRLTPRYALHQARRRA